MKHVKLRGCSLGKLLLSSRSTSSTASRSATASSPRATSSTASAETWPTTAARSRPSIPNRTTATTSPSPSNGRTDSAERGLQAAAASTGQPVSLTTQAPGFDVSCSTSIPIEQEFGAPLRVGRAVLCPPPFAKDHPRRARSGAPYRPDLRAERASTPDWHSALPWSNLLSQLHSQHDAAPPRTS